MVAGLNQTFTCKGNDHVPTWKDIAKASVIGCVTVCIIVGNTFSAAVINHSRNRKLFLKKVRLTMNSLICTDLCMGIFMCPFCIYPALYRCWPLGEPLCKVHALMISSLFFESTLSLVLIAVDRYFSVVHYLKYNNFMTPRKYMFAILVTWSLTFGLFSIMIFGAGQFFFDDIAINCEPYFPTMYVSVTAFVMFYLIPCLLFVYSYSSIFVLAYKRKKIGTSTSEKKNLRTSKFLAAITAGFFMAVTPWNICTVTIGVSHIKLNEDVDFIVTWLCISNSFWNVIIYSLLNPNFRQAAEKLTAKHIFLRFIRKCICCRTREDRISDNQNYTDDQGHTELSNIEQKCETSQNSEVLRDDDVPVVEVHL